MHAVLEAPLTTSARLRRQNVQPRRRAYCGDGFDVLLQGFHWDAHAGATLAGQKRSWYRIVEDNAPTIRRAGFSYVWLPPPSDSLAPEGYLPRRWHCLDSAYGSEGELRAALAALGPVRAMADIVLNHRVGIATAGADFADPPFADNRAAVVADDPSGVGLGQPGTGLELFHAARNLDHTNPGVQGAVRDYLRLLRRVGFAGFRYDFVKGFHGRFTGEYNDASAPLLSVGELFDTDVRKLTGWLAATGGRSAAFDFPLRYLLFDALKHDDYGRLATWRRRGLVPGGLLGLSPGRSVTFLDNHDTEYRRDVEHCYSADGTRHFAGSSVDLGYVYVLTHPGMPCVFWSHYFDWGWPTRARIDRLLELRRRAGIHARSDIEIHEATEGLYAAVIGGRLAVKLGRRDWWPGPDWHLALDGDRIAVWIRGIDTW